MKITMLGHATLLIEIDCKKILTDPWLTDPLYWGQLWHNESFKPKKLPHLDLILVSHGHEDHFDPKTLSRISKNTPVVIFKSYEKAARNGGFKEIHPVQNGDTFFLDGVEIKTLPGKHIGGTATYLITGKEGKVFFGGDTEYLDALANALNDSKPDACLIPISGGGIGPLKFHMGPKNAAKLVKASKASIAIPIHYHFKLKLTFLNSILLIDNCVEEFQKEMEEVCPEIHVQVLDYNEAWEK
jgi:L-ascorbate metabolism protein UlaG (beta-lactamase superfamily)